MTLSPLPPLFDRSPEAYAALEAHLHALHGATEAEALLLERVVDLTWRLRGVQLSLRGMETLARLAGAHEAERRGEAMSLEPWVQTPALEASHPAEVDAAIHALNQVLGALEDGHIPEQQVITEALVAAIGRQRRYYDKGELGRKVWLIDNLPFVAEARPDQLEAWTESAMEAIEDLCETLGARVDALEAEHDVRGAAIRERATAPVGDRTPELGKREAVLSRELRLAEAALRGAVGARRLGQLGGAWLRG